MPRQPGSRNLRRLVLGVSVLAVPLLALGVHSWRGDGAAAGADPQAAVEQLLASAEKPGPDVEHVYSQLERQLQRYPSDARARVFKARLDMKAGRYEAAAAGFAGAVAGASKAARDPDVWVEYAEATGMAQGGTLIGEPLRLVEKALALDANHAGALDLAGSAAWEKRDFTAAANHWKRLLAQLQAGTARHVELSTAVQRAEQRARLSLPAGR